MKLFQSGRDYVPQLPDQYTILPGSQHGYVVKLAWKRGSKIKMAVTVNYLNEIAPMLMRLCSSITLLIFSYFFLHENVTKLT